MFLGKIVRIKKIFLENKSELPRNSCQFNYNNIQRGVWGAKAPSLGNLLLCLDKVTKVRLV